MQRLLATLGLVFVLISAVSAQNRATFTVGTATAVRGQKLPAQLKSLREATPH